MSSYGWERGEVVLPASEFTKFKKALVELVTQRNERLLNVATEIYTKIKTQKPKDKNEFIDSQLKNYSFSFDEECRITDSLMKEKKLVKPKKQDFKLDKDKKNFHDSDLEVILVKEERKVIYHTDDNNHSIDHARKTFLGRNTLALLDQVKFTSHTGGYFRSQNEYDVDAGSGARVSKTFGKYKNPKHARSLYSL